MHRRRFLTYIGLSGALIPLAPFITQNSLAQTSFEDFKQQQNQGFVNYQEQLNKDFATYTQTLEQEFTRFKGKVKSIWGDTQIGDAKTYVIYSDDLSTRTLINFEQGQMRVEMVAPENSPNMGRQIRQQLVASSQLQVDSAYKQDPLLQNIEASLQQNITHLEKDAPSKEPLIADVLTGQKQPSTAQVEQAVITTAQQDGQASKRPAATAGKAVFSFSIPLKTAQISNKSEDYKPIVKKYAAQEKIDPALVLAIMHSESSFNPMAKSHIPAYGLMQIVPQSAGRDASEKVYGQQKLLSPSYLYNSDNNIKMGCAYLGILYYRYLKDIDNAESRTYCVIAAYNTGAGNVARAFNAGTSPAKAAVNINSMTPQQVYQRLVNNLPHAETRNYMKAVTPRYKAYQGQV